MLDSHQHQLNAFANVDEPDHTSREGEKDWWAPPDSNQDFQRYRRGCTVPVCLNRKRLRLARSYISVLGQFSLGAHLVGGSSRLRRLAFRSCIPHRALSGITHYFHQSRCPNGQISVQEGAKGDLTRHFRLVRTPSQAPQPRAAACAPVQSTLHLPEPRLRFTLPAELDLPDGR